MRTVRSIAEGENAPVVVICGKIEAEIAALESAEERQEFLEASGLTESGLNPLIRAAYSALGLRTFFTAGSDEDRAWTFREGSKAPQCAGIIHTDFEKGFIKAEVYGVDDLIEYGSEAHVREAGKLRLEGKDYAVQDGDILVVGVNSDESVRRLKGETRPIVSLPHRIALLTALECVDYVIPFEEDGPVLQ